VGLGENGISIYGASLPGGIQVQPWLPVTAWNARYGM